MADYRLSVNMIGRSSGRSATAAAAYRAGQRIEDRESGLVHDYTAKRGVMHTEIIAPANTPDWMRDRTELWNAVHKAETRKNSQLAREIQLSLPHELNHEQHANLVRRFVEEQCIARGMIADIAIHAPSSHPAADQRNHHAHVMLTTREFVGDGWAKRKNRDWHETEMIEEWREAWADHQNRELERIGSSERVDHRSLEDQGIMREPQKHLGPIATEIERDGRSSHRGNENRAIKARNGLMNDITQAGNVLDAKIAFEKRKLAVWQDAKRGQLRLDQEEREKQFEVQLSQDMTAFEASLDAEIGQSKQGISRAHEQVASRLQVRGWRKFIRDITLTTRKDKQELERLEYEKARVQAEEDRRREVEEKQQQSQRDIRATEEMKKARLLEKSLQKAEERREREGWTMKAGKGVRAAQEAQQRQEQQNPPPALPQKIKPDLQALREQREKTRREREPDLRDRRSYGEKQRSGSDRRPVDLTKGDGKGRVDQVQPLDIEAVRREAQAHRERSRERRMERGQSHEDDGYDI
ncbi:MobQ family relaxase [uncultured Tateyamaria sp.]|uniref:MobQ family relaxase n=1 Tax=uncultured Tateyamaria sp. TaxID=455651 RepID=UPI002613A3F6|nr:MobQ family relaxase [uncultured Tateyamaria sp.]